MHFIFIALSLFFALIFTLHVNGLQCFIEGNCVGIVADSAEKLDTFNECIDKCQLSNICIFNTFNPSNKFCYIYQHKICSDIKKEDCPMCLTSEKNCSVSFFLNSVQFYD